MNSYLKKYNITFVCLHGKKFGYGHYSRISFITKHIKKKYQIITIGDPVKKGKKRINNYKEYLLEQYFDEDFDKIKIDFINRINLYQAWTALRSAILIFYQQDENNPIDGVLEDCDKYLELATNNIHKINLH